MRGAREYAELFKSPQQHGKLFLVPGSHARGDTFRIYVLPYDYTLVGMPWQEKDAVEVYGIVSGNSGWTETYGWLHRGPWVEDFEAIVAKRKEEVEEQKRKRQQEKEEAVLAEKQRTKDLLAKY